MEKTIIDKIVSGEISTLELVERLKGFSREFIEDFIILMEIEGVDCKTIAMVRRELNVPDPLLEDVRRMQTTWQKVKSENGLELYSIDENVERIELTDEQVLKAVGLLQAALQEDQAEQKPEQAAPQFPPELNEENTRERFLSLLQKAIDCNLCDKSYHWQGTKALLTYFCARASNRLGLGKGMVIDSESIRNTQRPKIFWKPFETFFGVDGMCGAEKDYKRNGNRLPLGYEKVDNIFS